MAEHLQTKDIAGTSDFNLALEHKEFLEKTKVFSYRNSLDFMTYKRRVFGHGAFLETSRPHSQNSAVNAGELRNEQFIAALFELQCACCCDT